MNYPWIDDYCLSKKGAIKEFKAEWDAFRFMVGDKMFGMICEDKKGTKLFTLKCDPAFGEALRAEFGDITPGYYMNKLHWNSLHLEGVVPDEILKQMIDNSCDLVFKSLTKKMQNEITEND